MDGVCITVEQIYTQISHGVIQDMEMPCHTSIGYFKLFSEVSKAGLKKGEFNGVLCNLLAPSKAPSFSADDANVRIASSSKTFWNIRLHFRGR